jgi:hypothetical protein
MKLSGTMKVIIAIAVVAVILVGCGASQYNGIVAAGRAVVSTAWANVVTKFLPAPGRPHPQPRQHRQGLRQARGEYLQGSDRGPRQSHPDHRRPDPPYTREAQGVPGRTGRTECRTRQTPRRSGETIPTSRPTSNFQRTAGAARGNGEPHQRERATTVQRGRTGLTISRSAKFPVNLLARHDRLPAEDQV